MEMLLDDPSDFALDCVNAAQAAIYLGILLALLDEFGREAGGQVFSAMFPSIVLGAVETDPSSDPDMFGRFDRNVRPLFPPVARGSHVLPGDLVYVRNPQVDSASPWWSGEATIAVVRGPRIDDSTVVVAHGLRPSEVSVGRVVRLLNDKRRAGATQSAYVDNHYSVDSGRLIERVQWAADVEGVPWREGR